MDVGSIIIKNEKEKGMEINTNPNSIVPLYAQIVESLKRDIENGVYNATERIPAEAELAKQYNVSRITVQACSG